MIFHTPAAPFKRRSVHAATLSQAASPARSPDFSRILLMWSNIKARMRAAKAGMRDDNRSGR
jgi:hypothetical protein